MKNSSTLAGWGRQARPGREVLSEDFEVATRGMPLSRGLGRSYGDSSLPPPGAEAVAGSRLADRILAFDSATGLLRAEAGFTLYDLNWTFLSRNWAAPVCPGTQYITLGGMVAADVHGKNHHVDGTVGRHVERLKMRLADGRVVYCSRQEEADLFRATLGGMGLTGHVLEVDLRLQKIPSPWVITETERIPDLDTFLASLESAAHDWPMTMGWIDCMTRGKHMGRGVLFRGRWAEPGEAPAEPPTPKRRLQVPIDFPAWTLNPLTVRLFNMLVYWKQIPKLKLSVLHPEPFFYPLDTVLHWNRIYGKAGFTQHQSVIPKAAGTRGVRRFFDLLTSLGAASFLCVIKDCGEAGEGLLSFPMPGTSIALDIPVRKNTAEVVARLNECVIEEGGRIYLAKDTFTTAEHFRAMESRLDSWLDIKQKYDPEGLLASAQSARLGIDKLGRERKQ